MAKTTQIAKKLGTDAQQLALMTAGAIASQRYLNLASMFPNTPMVADNEGIIKMAVGLLAAGSIKNPMLKAVVMGVALDGAITTAERFVTGTSSAARPGYRAGLQPMQAAAQLESGVAGRSRNNMDQMIDASVAAYGGEEDRY